MILNITSITLRSSGIAVKFRPTRDSCICRYGITAPSKINIVNIQIDLFSKIGWNDTKCSCYDDLWRVYITASDMHIELAAIL